MQKQRREAVAKVVGDGARHANAGQQAGGLPRAPPSGWTGYFAFAAVIVWLLISEP